MTITVRTISNHGGDFRCSATCTVANGLKLPHQFALGHVAADAAPHLRSGRRSVALGKPLRSQAASGMGAPLCSATEALNWHYKFTNFIFSKQNKTKKTVRVVAVYVPAPGYQCVVLAGVSTEFSLPAASWG